MTRPTAAPPSVPPSVPPSDPPSGAPSDAPSAGPSVPPSLHADVPEMLAEAGLEPAAAEALMALDSALFFWHRFAAKGEMARLLLTELGLALDLSQFHALTAISRIQQGVGRSGSEQATVGLVAEEMAIDPSRASRITSGLIEAGYLRREAAQDDGRKAVLVFTDKTHETFRRLRALKWQKILRVFEGWSEDDIQCFARLFGRYGDDIRRVYLGD